MAKRHFIYQGKVHGQETVIYYLVNEKTGKKQFYVLESIPEEYQTSEEGLAKAQRIIESYNQEKNKKVALVSLTDSLGRKEWFVREPSMMIPALLKARSVENEIQKEQKRIDEMNKEIDEIKKHRVERVVKSSVVQYKKPSKAKQIAIRVAAVGLSALILLGSAGILNDVVKGVGPNDGTERPGITETYTPEETTLGPVVDGTLAPEGTLAPDTPAPPIKNPYTDLDTLTYSTHKNEAGTEFLELADALKIADACYDNLQIELGSAEHDYSFDASKFGPEMFVGEAISENSLKVIKDYVNKYGCRGMMMIGTAATKEANEVSMKLTGEAIIENSEELDNPVEALMTAMYIAVKNYEYCADIVGPENVTPEMVFDCYLYGCGNLRSWLRECMVDGQYDGSYQARNYSKKILYYGECLEPYKDALDSGLTDGSHDEYWQYTYYERLWKVPDFNAAATTENERE